MITLSQESAFVDGIEEIILVAVAYGDEGIANLDPVLTYAFNFVNSN